ncbi:MAG: helix-turn-helix domain-containing protein, partial [Candidatus Dormibacteria bacterium]
MAVKIDWERVAAAVKDARLELHWSIEEATRRANLSSKTYRQVERGERVHFRSLEAIQRAFGWPPNMAELISSGHHPSEIMRDRPRQQTALEDPPHNDLNTVDAYEEVLKFSMRALRSNADPDVVETFQRSAARLLKEI